MMMWQMSGGTCAALRSPPVESNANPLFSDALVTGRELQLATQPPPTIYSNRNTSNTAHDHRGTGRCELPWVLETWPDMHF